MEPIYQAKVHADNDYPVKMREAADTKSEVLAKIPQGTIVDVLGIVGSDEGDWGFIMYNGRTGYMMNKFLIPINDEKDSVSVNRNDVEQVIATLESLVKNIKNMIG